jgi:radical SAM superfamily enzyme YgiQ (UPF0313 family)
MSKVKIGLIDPGFKRMLLDYGFPYVGLAYIAAVLEKQGHEVRTLDLGLASEEQTERFLKDGYELIGLSATSFTYGRALETAKNIKAINKDIVTVLGGPHVAIEMGSILNSPQVDYAVYGEGELTIAEFVEVLEKDRTPTIENLSSIKGLIFRDGHKIVTNPARSRIENLDELPYPAFHLFDMDKYGAFPLLTSRGCPFACAFCSIKAIWGTLWKYRSPGNIVEEIEYACERFNWEKKPFNIIDDSFNVKPKRVMDVCDLLIERGLNIKWFCWGIRADRISLPMALKMKEAGCYGVSVGIESASNDVLKTIKKRETIEQITMGCQNLKQAGIPIHAQFMIGNAGGTFETFKQSIEYAKKQRFSTVAFYLPLPYPKTELWDYVKKHGRFLKEDYTQFHHFSTKPVFETPGFSAQERTKAYALARRFALQTRIREELRIKLNRIKRLDFEGVSLRKMVRAACRLNKIFLDLALKRDEKV